MAYAASAFRTNRRPIPDAVATLGASDRLAFLRRTYAHLGGALIAFTLFTAGMMRFATDLSLTISFPQGGGMGWLLLMLVAFIGVAFLSQRLAASESSRALQYLGMALAVVLWSILAQPIIWITIAKFGNPADFLTGDKIHPVLSAKAALVISEAAIITLAIFIGLTVTVFVTRKDFSFLRGVLGIAMAALIGIVLCAMLFGFQIGVLYSVAVVLVMGGYILYQTSLVMNYFRPTQHVAAAVMLFTTVAMLFIHVLRILAEVNRR
ncbi:MAG TPA: Bax inhibitor-1 family protein [Kofleriaceae bacterium]|jgi:hypothetical protein